MSSASDTQPERQPVCEPPVVTIGRLLGPEENFDWEASVRLSPWWSITQALAWITTRSTAFAELLGRYDEENAGKDMAVFAFGAILPVVAERFCACTAPLGSPDLEPYERCSCVQDAGRTLLSKIAAGEIDAFDAAAGRRMGLNDFVHIGADNSAWDWRLLTPPPSFYSARLIAAFSDTRPQHSGLLGTSHREAATTNVDVRSPSVKGGRPPSDDEILGKADEMKTRGLTKYEIASKMRFEPGFENVGTVLVRELTRGRWKPAGRPPQHRA